MNLFQPNLDPAAPIQPEVAHQVAIRFGLTVANVRVDARDVATWVGPEDALRRGIEHRRGLAPPVASTYIATLRRALSAN